MKDPILQHELRTEIEIDAPPGIVWSVLTDLDHYGEWNPFVVSAEGSVVVGGRLKNRLQPPGGRAMTFRPTVTIVDTGRTFEWCGQLGVPGIFDGRHRFDLRGTAAGTRFIQTEQFSGLLVRFMRRSLDTRTQQGFEEMNQALKARSESHANVSA